MVTEAYLRQKYLNEKLSLRQIAADCALSAGTLRYHMKRWGIPRRTKSEALSGDKNPMHGKPKSIEARRKTSETLRVTNEDPLVKARRSAGTSGTRNPMYGKTHTAEVKAASKALLNVLRAKPEFIQAHREAMGRPEVRQAISKSAKKRVGPLNPFFGREHTPETKQHISKANRGRFQGANGSNWQGGKTRLTTLIRNSEPAVRWRKAVFARDAFTCPCGKVGGPLHADHIRPLALLLRENKITTLEEAYACQALWDLTNGRTLCVPCHKKTSSYAGNYQKTYGKSSTVV
jgi:5-methylcytosine-specific restriction endonuclease McrA